MIHRFIREEDYPLLTESLSKDEFHQGTTLAFFLEEGTVCSVYEDEKGIVLFARGKPIIYNDIGIIQLDLQFLDNYDAKRNINIMSKGLQELETKAIRNGFNGFFFESKVPLLKKFCVKRLGFQEYGDLLVKVLPKE